MNDQEAAEFTDEVRHDLALITALTTDVIPKVARLNAWRERQGLPAIVIDFPKLPEGCGGD